MVDLNVSYEDINIQEKGRAPLHYEDFIMGIKA